MARVGKTRRNDLCPLYHIPRRRPAGQHLRIGQQHHARREAPHGASPEGDGAGLVHSASGVRRLF